MDDTLSLHSTRDGALKARDRYRMLLAVALLAEGAAGLALLIFARGLARSDSYADTSEIWLRICGLLLLVVTALLATGHAEPSRNKLLNLCGLVSRLGMGVLLVVHGGELLWPGLAEIGLALRLAQLFFKYFEAEVMSRP